MDYDIKEIERINNDPVKRRTIMTYEERLKESKFEGKVEGKAEGRVEERARVYKEIGKTEQEALKDIIPLNIIDPEEATEIIEKIYKEDVFKAATAARLKEAKHIGIVKEEAVNYIKTLNVMDPEEVEKIANIIYKED